MTIKQMCVLQFTQTFMEKQEKYQQTHWFIHGMSVSLSTTDDEFW